MADQKRFRVYMETKVSAVVEVDAPDIQTALEAAAADGPYVSTTDNAWEQAGDWEALVAYDAGTNERLYPQPASGQTPRNLEHTVTDPRDGEAPVLGVYGDGDQRYVEISAFRTEADDAFAVQIDTGADLGQLRVFVNDGAVYDADPMTGESNRNDDVRKPE